jgi:hypothetical protein
MEKFEKLSTKIADLFDLNKINNTKLKVLINNILNNTSDNMGEDQLRILEFFNNLRSSSEVELKDIDLDTLKTKENISSLFHPEINYEVADIENIRKNREVKVETLNIDPIKNPFSEILFTSNILLTTPHNIKNVEDEEIRNYLEANKDEEEKYWFDHPVALDEKAESNEILYGLKHLSKAVKAEGNHKLTVVLSITVTHDHINKIARKYIKNLLKNEDLSNLNIFIFTEDDTKNIVDNFKIDSNFKDMIKEVFGVEGMYGRHYSFLKAVLPLWNQIMDEDIKAVFKIDLDQVFPQDNLLKETGSYAFEKFKSALWGAKGIDHLGNEVELGMIAGSLVNENDIHKSIYEPDVAVFGEEKKLDENIFRSQKPQYISTIAEMSTRYKNEDDCIMRYHVTGGTNGILLNTLKKYRPFTPTFIGRAEDQAYLLSVIFDDSKSSYLRYLHCDGLIMRHDKENFAGESIKRAKISKMVGDYERILLFSNYSNKVLGKFNEIKEELAPFTSSFMSEYPNSVVYFRAIFKAIDLANENPDEALDFLMNLSSRLTVTLNNIDENYYLNKYNSEKVSWNLFYDILEDKKYDTNKIKNIILKNSKI